MNGVVCTHVQSSLHLELNAHLFEKRCLPDLDQDHTILEMSCVLAKEQKKQTRQDHIANYTSFDQMQHGIVISF